MEIFEKYYTIAVKFLSFRPRSEKEVRDKLSQKKAPSEIIDAIIKLLKEQRFINDEDFIKWWREQRTRFRPKSDRAIKQELRKKGIDKELIENIFAQQEITMYSDLDKARILVKKQLAKINKFPLDEQYRKLGAYLARRGFDWETIKTAIDDILKKQYNSF